MRDALSISSLSVDTVSSLVMLNLEPFEHVDDSGNPYLMGVSQTSPNDLLPPLLDPGDLVSLCKVAPTEAKSLSDKHIRRRNYGKK